MNSFEIGDIVVRKSYGEDEYFRIANIIQINKDKPVYILKGLSFRLEADSNGEDLIKRDSETALNHVRSSVQTAKRKTLNRGFSQRLALFKLFRGRTGNILHVDSSQEFMDICIKHYTENRINVKGKCLPESDQPNYIRQLLEKYRPDILVVTGHDGYKKNGAGLHSMSSYSNSKYYVQSVKEARSYEPDKNKLCIFAGACQSYFEAIMDAGANFASSPGRILINALDPAIVSEKISLTDNRRSVTPQEAIKLTISGSAGIGGIVTRGHLII
jgi:spore coat assemly protein